MPGGERRLQPQTRIILGLVTLLIPGAHLFGQEPQAPSRLPHLQGAIVLDDVPGERDREALEPLWLTMYNPAVKVTPSEQTEVDLAFEVDNEGDVVVGVLDDLTVVNNAEESESFSAQIVRLRTLASLDSHTSANAFLQLNVTAKTVAGELRFQYNLGEGKDLWIGWKTGSLILGYTYTFWN